jgi:hypothetical protein
MYITIRGRVDTIEDESYERMVKKGGKKVEETVTRFGMSLSLPGSNEMIKVSLSGENIVPGQKQMDDWELNESWVQVECDGWSHRTGTTEDDRAWSMVSFRACEMPHELSAQERKDLMTKRQGIKTQKKEAAKKRRQERQAEKTKAAVAQPAA